MKSEYWATLLENYMSNGEWKSWNHSETFYATFFPNDIPDEWSLADREKSHGRGLGKSEGLARIQFIRATLQRSKSLELWNSQFPPGPETDCSMEWDSLYSLKPIYSLPMKPFTKVFEVA